MRAPFVQRTGVEELYGARDNPLDPPWGIEIGLGLHAFERCCRRDLLDEFIIQIGTQMLGDAPYATSQVVLQICVVQPEHVARQLAPRDRSVVIDDLSQRDVETVVWVEGTRQKEIEGVIKRATVRVAIRDWSKIRNEVSEREKGIERVPEYRYVADIAAMWQSIVRGVGLQASSMVLFLK